MTASFTTKNSGKSFAEKQSAEEQAPCPTSLQRPLVPTLTRMLAGRPMQEEILDPANPNLIIDRDP